MARKRKTSPAEDLVDLVALLPWWVGVAMAIVSYFALHTFAVSAPPKPALLTNMSEVMIGTMTRAAAQVGQFILPLICLVGAAVSAWRRQQRRTLVNDVAKVSAADALNAMTWQEFELLVGEAFRMLGYRVIETGSRAGDGGIDLVLLKGSEKFYVQCKQWKAFKVGVDVVRELYGVMAAQGAVGGFVVTSGRFTDAAVEFSRGRNVKLIDGPALLKLIHSVKTSRSAAHPSSTATVATTSPPTPVCPKCEKPMVRRQAKKGTTAGQSFWGCPSYPACKGTRPIP